MLLEAALGDKMKWLSSLLLWLSVSCQATPILIYHHITSDPSDDLRISLDHFKQQVDWLREEGYEFHAVRDLPASPKSVVLTFDDGWKNNLPALAYLQEKGATATIFAISGMNHGNYLSSEDLRRLSDHFEIGAHTHTHFMSLIESPMSVDDIEAIWELALSKEILERTTGKPVTSLSWPFGIVFEKVVPIQEALGFKVSVNVQAVRKSTDHHVLDRLTVDGRCDLETFKRMVRTGVQILCAEPK